MQNIIKNKENCSPLRQVYKPTIISNYVSKNWTNIQQATQVK